MSVLPEVPESVKEKASDILLSMVNVTIQTMNDVVAFGKQQIPEVIHQLLMWKAVESFVYFAIHILLVIVGILLMTRWGSKIGKAMALKREAALREYEEGAAWTRFGSSNLTSPSYDFIMNGSPILRWAVVSLGVMVVVNEAQAALQYLDWLKIIIAPKVYLIEYGASLVKAV